MKALLLDLDGTIIDTMDLIWQCFRDTLAEQQGLDVEREFFRRCAGLHLREMFTLALREQGRPEVDIEPLVLRYRERQVGQDGSLRAFPGVVETLRELRGRGARLAIVTTKLNAVARRHLGALGLADLFEVIVAGDNCSRHKPDPEPFQLALAALGVDPRQAAGAGDTHHDVAAARAAGLLAGAACWGAEHREALLASRPDAVLEQPADLLHLWERLR